MAKPRHNEPQPSTSRNALIFMSLGGIAVAGLVVWALTRTVETTPEPAPPVVATSPQPSPLTPLATTATSATSLTTPPPAVPQASEADTTEVPRISAEDLREKWSAKSVTIIDVRDNTAFATSHIPGALHIPFASMEASLSTIPEDKPIVTYCT